MKDKVYIEDMDGITAGHIEVMQTMMGKCEDQLATIQVTQRSLCRTEKELQQLQSELDRTINERETLRIQVDRLEMRMQNNMRRLVSELQTDMQNRVSVMAAEALRMKECKEKELDASHNADLAMLNEKHAKEIAVQMKAYQQDLAERDEKAQSQVQAYKKRIDEIEDQLKELRLHNRAIKHQRNFLNERLRVMMQNHCEEALRLLEMHGCGRSISGHSCQGSATSINTRVPNKLSRQESECSIHTPVNTEVFECGQTRDGDQNPMPVSSMSLVSPSLPGEQSDDQQDKDTGEVKEMPALTVCRSPLPTSVHQSHPSKSEQAAQEPSMLSDTLMLSTSTSYTEASQTDDQHQLFTSCDDQQCPPSCEVQQLPLASEEQHASSREKRQHSSPHPERQHSLPCEEQQHSSPHQQQQQHSLPCEEQQHSSPHQQQQHSLPCEEQQQSSPHKDRQHPSTCENQPHSLTHKDRKHSFVCKGQQPSTCGDRLHSSTHGDHHHSSTCVDHQHSSTYMDQQYSSPCVDPSHSKTHRDRHHSSNCVDQQQALTCKDQHCSSCTDQQNLLTCKNQHHASACGGQQHSLNYGDEKQYSLPCKKQQHSLLIHDRQRSLSSGHRQCSLPLDSQQGSLFGDDRLRSLSSGHQPCSVTCQDQQNSVSACQDQCVAPVCCEDQLCVPIDDPDVQYQTTLAAVTTRFKALQQQIEQLQQQQMFENMVAQQLNQQQKRLKQKQEETEQLQHQLLLQVNTSPPPGKQSVALSHPNDGATATDRDVQSLSPEEAVVAVATQFNALQTQLQQLQQHKQKKHCKQEPLVKLLQQKPQLSAEKPLPQPEAFCVSPFSDSVRTSHSGSFRTSPFKLSHEMHKAEQHRRQTPPQQMHQLRMAESQEVSQQSCQAKSLPQLKQMPQQFEQQQQQTFLSAPRLELGQPQPQQNLLVPQQQTFMSAPQLELGQHQQHQQQNLLVPQPLQPQQQQQSFLSRSQLELRQQLQQLVPQQLKPNEQKFLAPQQLEKGQLLQQMQKLQEPSLLVPPQLDAEQQQKQHEHWLRQQQKTPLEQCLPTTTFLQECQSLVRETRQHQKQQRQQQRSQQRHQHQMKMPQENNKPWHHLPPSVGPTLDAFPSPKHWPPPEQQLRDDLFQQDAKLTSPKPYTSTAFKSRPKLEEAGDMSCPGCDKKPTLKSDAQNEAIGCSDTNDTMNYGNPVFHRQDAPDAGGEAVLTAAGPMAPLSGTDADMDNEDENSDRCLTDGDCNTISEHFWEHEERQKDLQNYVNMLKLVQRQLLVRTSGEDPSDNAEHTDKDLEAFVANVEPVQSTRLLLGNSSTEQQKLQPEHIFEMEGQDSMSQLAELYTQVVNQRATCGPMQQDDEQDAELGQLLRFYIKDLQNLNSSLQNELKQVSDACTSSISISCKTSRQSSRRSSELSSSAAHDTRGLQQGSSTHSKSEQRHLPATNKLSSSSITTGRRSIKRNNSQRYLSAQCKQSGVTVSIPNVFERLHKATRSTNLYSGKDQKHTAATKLATRNKNYWRY